MVCQPYAPFRQINTGEASVPHHAVRRRLSCRTLRLETSSDTKKLSEGRQEDRRSPGLAWSDTTYREGVLEGIPEDKTSGCACGQCEHAGIFDGWERTQDAAACSRIARVCALEPPTLFTGEAETFQWGRGLANACTSFSSILSEKSVLGYVACIFQRWRSEKKFSGPPGGEAGGGARRTLHERRHRQDARETRASGAPSGSRC
jgi:hypothetical protein